MRPIALQNGWKTAFLLVIAMLGALLALVPVGCKDDESRTASVPSAKPGDPLPATSEPTIDILFTYGSEKQPWIEQVTAGFNAESTHRTPDGKRVRVQAVPLGSGESIDELLGGRRQAHLTSPASKAFIEIGNAKSRAATGKDLIGPTQDLVLSPVVIAMWKPMAEALGWPKKPVGWADVLAMAKDEKGWAGRGHPEWGQFKFGHTHPEYSNSGLISLLAEVYAGAGKVGNLTTADVQDPKVGQFLHDIESSVVHYGSSTGFFGRTMFDNGPQYLSAAVLYENMVIESYGKQDLTFPVVAVYPKEGTFWSDHPVGVIQREWVTDAHKAAAKVYVDYLLDRPQQELAMTHGFRPGDPAVALATPIDAAHGVDPKEPTTTLAVPPAEVMDAVVKLWHVNKKHAEIVLVFDTSGSMKAEERMPNARAGAQQLIDLLGDEDKLSLLPFSDVPRWSLRSTPMKQGRDTARNTVGGLYPDGGTALYDSVGAAYAYLKESADPKTISAVVVLTDGDDTKSNAKLEDLLSKVSSVEGRGIRVFTIKYGSDAKGDILKKISNVTQAKYFEGTPQNIREVFKEIATFF